MGDAYLTPRKMSVNAADVHFGPSGWFNCHDLYHLHVGIRSAIDRVRPMRNAKADRFGSIAPASKNVVCGDKRFGHPWGRNDLLLRRLRV